LVDWVLASDFKGWAMCLEDGIIGQGNEIRRGAKFKEVDDSLIKSSTGFG